MVKKNLNYIYFFFSEIKLKPMFISLLFFFLFCINPGALVMMYDLSF